MPSHATLKLLALTAAGVILAGLIMYYGKEYSIPLIDKAADGFDY